MINELKFLNRNLVIVKPKNAFYSLLEKENIEFIDKKESIFLIDECDHSDLINEQLLQKLPSILFSFIVHSTRLKKVDQLLTKLSLEAHFELTFHWFVNDLSSEPLGYETV